METTISHGIVRGKTIELDEAPPFSDGEPVTVEIHPQRAAGDGIRASAGTWSDSNDELDQWLDEVYRARHAGRSSNLP